LKCLSLPVMLLRCWAQYNPFLAIANKRNLHAFEVWQFMGIEDGNLDRSNSFMKVPLSLISFFVLNLRALHRYNQVLSIVNRVETNNRNVLASVRRDNTRIISLIRSIWHFYDRILWEGRQITWNAGEKLNRHRKNKQYPAKIRQYPPHIIFKFKPSTSGNIYTDKIRTQYQNW